MLEIGTSGLMSGEEKRVVILLLGDLIPRSFSTLPKWETCGGWTDGHSVRIGGGEICGTNPNGCRQDSP